MLGRALAALALCLSLGGCATHRIVVSHPNPTDIPTETSSTSYAWSALQKRTATCGDAGMDEVLVRQTLGNSLLSIITLGTVNRIELRYVCRKIAPSEGSTDEEPAAPQPGPGSGG